MAVLFKSFQFLLQFSSFLFFFRADDVASDFTLRGVIVQSIHGDRYK